jgi:nucleotide-binding universal stress UspA family protein
MTDLAGNFLKGKVNRILVPIDFSSRSPLALEHAVEVARIYGASIWLLHVLDVTVFVAGVVPGALAEIIMRSELALEELAASPRGQHIECTTLLQKGDLDGQIEETIAEYNIDMLVLSTKAGTAMAGFSLASTAERILRKTSIPVLTIADCRPVRKWAGDGCFHLFYATDLSPQSIRSFQYARALEHRLCVELTLAHVLPNHASPEKIEAVSTQLNALAEGTPNKVAILHGTVGPAICEASSLAGADLIVIGVKKHSVLREVLLGHTLLEILYGARCPVLTIRL